MAVLETQTGEISKNQGIFIRPQRSKVSPFCTELTTITQKLLDKKSVLFEEAINQLIDEYNPDLYTWASYGQYDLNMLKKQCKSFGITYPISKQKNNSRKREFDRVNPFAWFFLHKSQFQILLRPINIL